MNIYLEIDSFNSLDYFRIFRTKISNEPLSKLINGLILTANFLFKSNIEKIHKIKQIVSNFKLPIMVNPNTNYYYQFETQNAFIDNEVKNRYLEYYKLNSFIYSKKDDEIKKNIEKILNFQREFFKIEETIEKGTLLDFIDEIDKKRIIKIEHFLITPYLYLGKYFHSDNIEDYIRICSQFQNNQNNLKLILYFDEHKYSKIKTIISNWNDKFDSIILWNSSYNEFYNSKEQLLEFKRFLDNISEFKDKLIFSYAGIMGIRFLQDYFSGFIIKKQLYPGDKKIPPTESQILSSNAQIKYGAKTRTFYNPLDHNLNSKIDFENPINLAQLKDSYNCDCFICKNKVLKDRRFFGENIIKLFDNTRNKFYHNLYCILKDLLILKIGNIEEKDNIVKKIQRYNNWREIFV